VACIWHLAYADKINNNINKKKTYIDNYKYEGNYKSLIMQEYLLSYKAKYKWKNSENRSILYFYINDKQSKCCIPACQICFFS